MSRKKQGQVPASESPEIARLFQVAPEAAPAPAAETKERSLEDQYMDRLHAFLVEANEARAMSEFVGALTWALARVASHYGRPFIAGDIVRRFGGYLCNMEDQKAAAAEAAEARAAGRPLN